MQLNTDSAGRLGQSGKLMLTLASRVILRYESTGLVNIFYGCRSLQIYSSSIVDCLFFASENYVLLHHLATAFMSQHEVY
jgi:hypothetical protein